MNIQTYVINKSINIKHKIMVLSKEKTTGYISRFFLVLMVVF